MTSRRRERLGARQTNFFPQPHQITTLPRRQSQISVPGQRAQTACLPQNSKAFRRASTASARFHVSREGAVDAHPRRGVFLPQSAYEAEESNKFYTASPVCTLGRIFSDSSLIRPTWAKVVTTPWGEAARVSGGYGKRLLNGANSVESPDFMFSKNFGSHTKDYSFKKRPRPFAYNGEANTAVSYDTPNFFRARHTQVYGQPIEKIDKPRLLKIRLGRQIITEPEVREPDLAGGPLDWSGLETTVPRALEIRH